MCLCHYIISVCSGRFVKEIQVVTASENPLGQSLHLNVVFCFVYSLSQLLSLSLSLYCSKIRRYANAESSWTTLVLLRCTHTLCRKTAEKSRFGRYQTPVCVCTHVDMENRRRVWGCRGPLLLLLLCIPSFAAVLSVSLGSAQHRCNR